MSSALGHISKVLGTSDGGFAPVAASGSSSTYYADYCLMAAGGCVRVGGDWGNAGNAGVFCFYAGDAASYSDSILGCRICYL